MNTKAIATKLESIKLIGPHTHAGKACVAGDKIDVTPSQKQWLIDHHKVADPTAIQSSAAAAIKE